MLSLLCSLTLRCCITDFGQMTDSGSAQLLAMLIVIALMILELCHVFSLTILDYVFFPSACVLVRC